MPNNVRVFISYASEDDPIAVQLANTLKNAFGADIHLFLDKRSIRAGQSIPDAIAGALESADILAVISTGIGKPSHDWGGWEIGYFEMAHKSRSPDRGLLWGTMASICPKEHPPAPSESKKYISLEIDAAALDDSLDDFKRKMGYGEGSARGIRDDDAMLLWFGEIGNATGHGDIDQQRDLRDNYKARVAEFKINIFQELKGRVKVELKPQKQLLFQYNLGDPKKPVKSLPDDTRITPRGGVMSVFGLPPNETTWKEFRNLVVPSPLGNFWCGALERMVLSANGAAEVNVDNSQLIASTNPLFLYRLILTTGTCYYNNQMDVSIYFVDFYRRTDYGDPKTSLLLKALQLVSRYRFMFLEDLSEFHYLNIALTEIGHLPDLARRIIGELDLLTSDMYVANLQIPTTWGQFVSLKTVEQMYSAWDPLDKELRKIYDTIALAPEKKSAGALTDEEVDAKQREGLLKARAEFANKLMEIREKTLGFNTELLRAMAQKLSELTVSTPGTAVAPLSKPATGS